MRLVRAVVAAAALLAVISAGNVALAHAAYKSSDPPDDGRVGAPPTQVSAEFTEPLAGGSYLQITDPCGERVDGGDVSISGYTMSVSMSGDAAGLYTVFYKAYSQLDPHVTQGEFTFTASSGAACAGAASNPKRESTNQGSGSSGSSSGSSTTSTSTTGDDGAGTSSSGGAPEPRSADRSRNDRADRGSADSGGGRRSTRDRQRASVPNVTAAAARETRPKPVWDGIRLDSFLTGLLLAAIIGAAGGKIYAGIMGPRA